MDWQTTTAFACVIATLLIFIIRLFRPKSKSGCGKDCGCGDELRKTASFNSSKRG